MPKASKFSPDEGLTIYDLKDNEAVHYGNQSKGYVGKNLIFANGTTQTISGVTFTVNSDGTITANGTSTTDIWFDVYADNYQNFYKRCGGSRVSVIISGCADNGSSSTYCIAFALYNPNRVQASEFGNGNVISFTIPTNEDTTCKLYIYIKSGVTVSNLVFKPMIRLASIPDSTYEPYLTPNTDLMSYKDNGVLGAKNLLLTVLDTFSTLGVTFTPNSDGTIIANGKANGGTASFNLTTGENIGKPNNYLKLPKGQYILSDGTNDSSTNTTYGMWIAKHIGNTRTDVARTNNGYAIFTVNGDEDYFDVGLMIRNGVTVTDKLFSPMIRLVSDPDSTYQSPSKTNQELTNDAKVVYKDIQSQIAAKIGTQTGYSLSTSQMWEDSQRVDLCIWLTSVSQALSLNWDLSGVIPKAAQRAGASVAARDGNASGICWVNSDAASLFIRIPAPTVTQEFLLRLTYYK